MSLLVDSLNESAASTKLFLTDVGRKEDDHEAEEVPAAGVRGRGIRERSLRSLSSGLPKGHERQVGDAIVFSSRPPGEAAAESSQEHRGAFSYFLARGLRGEADLEEDGVVSLAEFIRFVTQKVTGWVRPGHPAMKDQNVSGLEGGWPRAAHIRT